MKVSETHSNYPGGAKGRLIIRDDAGNVIDTIFTPQQKARAYCMKFPESPEGVRFAAAVVQAGGSSVPVLSVPLPPVLAGKNAANTALMSAQRKLEKLHEAALNPVDPVAALRAIHTSRGNKYLNTCDDYRVALLKHFGVGI